MVASIFHSDIMAPRKIKSNITADYIHNAESLYVNKEGDPMVFAVVVLIFAIFIAYSQREEPIKIAYTGGALLAVGAVSFIVFSVVMSNVGTVGYSWQSSAIMQSLGALLVLTPAGLIMTIIGLVKHKKKYDSKEESG